MTWSPPTNIYFVRPVGAVGPLKIGCATDPASRLINLQGWSPVALEIVLTVPGTMYDEKLIHRTFAEHRLHGEWFNDCADVAALMADISAHGCLPAWAVALHPNNSVYLRKAA